MTEQEPQKQNGKSGSQLDRIHSPADLKEMTLPELQQLADELRDVIVDTVSQNGGHLSPSLGVVELTIALHRVFNAPADKILWDVGHQSYPHKLLTGRKERFHTLRRTDGLCGFCRPDESEYDPFLSGHAGSAISAAMGFSAANTLNGSGVHVVTVVGDGSLINGISLEALNNLRSTCKQLILVINDNAMSISKSIGAIPRSLNRLITGKSYNRFKAFSKLLLHRFPGGSAVVTGIQQLESSAKNLFVPGLFFEELGIRYVGPINGHDLPALLRTFENVKDWNRPVVIHVVTEKGHGCPYAQDAPEKFHGTGSFDPVTGALTSGRRTDTFSAAFGRTIPQLTEQDGRTVVITAAMASGCGITDDFIRQYSDRFFDVGIAEEHAVTFAAGLAAAGKRPIVALYATFLQRGLDCVFHDICLQSLPVTLCIDRAGIVEDGPTHHGIYDLSFLLAMPGLAVMMPENEQVLTEMMMLAQKQDHPVVIRYPRGGSGCPEHEPPCPVVWGQSVEDRTGADGAIWTTGRELYTARAVSDILRETHGLELAVHNARFLKPFDRTALLKCAAEKPVFTLEDHVLQGGLGSIAAETLINAKHCGLYQFGWDTEKIVPHGSIHDLRKNAGLLPGQIAERIAEYITAQRKEKNA